MPASDAEKILARFPGPVRLQLHVGRRLLALVVSTAAAALFGYFLLTGQVSGWFDTIMTPVVIVLFVLLALRALILLLAPGGARLTLDGAGFTVSTIFWHVPAAWRDAKGFRVEASEDAAGLPVVMYEVKSDGATETRALPHLYGLSADDLARLLNAWRQRALDM